MRKFYTLLIASTITWGALAQWGQIENGGFENWTNLPLYDTPDDWISSNDVEYYGADAVSQSTDAQDGIYSARIETKLLGNDTIAGYVYHGETGTSGPDTGIPYTDNFEAISLQYKSDLPVGDTLFMFCIRYQLGTPVETQILPVCYGTNSTWTSAILYVGNQSQDELFIGFIASNPGGEYAGTPGAWSQIDNVQLISGGVQTTTLPNHSFENWTNVSSETPDNWYTLNSLLIGAGIENATKTTDANSGSYAIEMTTKILDLDTIASFLSNGPINFGANNPFMPMPYAATPTTFSGAYKYTPINGDLAFLQVQFFASGTMIGFHVESLTDQNTFTPFSSALTIAGTPDSVSIIGYSGETPGSTLILDDLSFSGNNVSLEEFVEMEVNMHPNPAKSKVMIKANGLFNYEIIDLTGNIVSNRNNIQNAIEIDIDHLNVGSYFVHISNETTTETHKLIIQ